MKSKSKEISADAAALLQRVENLFGNLLIWTITYGTGDYGKLFVARPHRVSQGDSRPLAAYLIADNMLTLHSMLPPGLSRMKRDPNDDPVIIEVWL